MKLIKYFVLVILCSFLFVSISHAGSEKYNIYLKNGKTLSGYQLHKSRKDSSILVAKKGKRRIELKKVNISSYNKVNSSSGSRNKSGRQDSFEESSYRIEKRTRLTNNRNITPYNYSYNQLLKTDVHHLDMLVRQAQEIILTEYDQLHKNKVGSKKYRDIRQRIDKYSTFKDDAHRATVVQRGLEANDKLARDDWSTEAGLGMLIEDSVELKMLPYRRGDDN